MNITIATTRLPGHIAEIRFARPPHNFACPALLGQIADALDALDADAEVSCGVLVGEGRNFCGGADLAGDDAMVGAGGMDAIAGLYEQAERLFRRAKPLVAAVQGAAVGAGLGLALSADFRVGAARSRFAANFTALGFHPGFALTHTLPRLIGEQRAAWMMLSSERVRGEAALAWGLIDRMVEEEDVTAAAHAMARELAANAPLALVAVRRTLSRGRGDAVRAAMAHEHAQQAALKTTADYAEGVAAVFARRAPAFTGR